MTGLVLGVAVDAPLRRLFDYRAPPQVPAELLAPGLRVWVPFGKRKTVGTIMEGRSTSEVPAQKLRSALALIDTEPVLELHGQVQELERVQPEIFDDAHPWIEPSREARGRAGDLLDCAEDLLVGHSGPPACRRLPERALALHG